MPKPFQPTVLETARLKLRFMEERDADAIFAIYSDAQVARYLSKPTQTERAQAAKMVGNILAGYAEGTSVTFAMERRDDRVVIGNCMLFSISEQSRRAEIGYSMARAHWGQGYMDEALRALVDYGFSEPLNLNRIEADIDPRNAGSAKSLTRLGFRQEGVLRERWIVAEKSRTPRTTDCLRASGRRAREVPSEIIDGARSRLRDPRRIRRDRGALPGIAAGVSDPFEPGLRDRPNHGKADGTVRVAP